jgi:hypothetical protein
MDIRKYMGGFAKITVPHIIFRLILDMFSKSQRAHVCYDVQY